jgi:hypothetical protein
VLAMIALRMGAKNTSETSLNFYQTTHMTKKPRRQPSSFPLDVSSHRRKYGINKKYQNDPTH